MASAFTETPGLSGGKRGREEVLAGHGEGSAVGTPLRGWGQNRLAKPRETGGSPRR